MPRGVPAGEPEEREVVDGGDAGRGAEERNGEVGAVDDIEAAIAKDPRELLLLPERTAERAGRRAGDGLDAVDGGRGSERDAEIGKLSEGACELDGVDPRARWLRGYGTSVHEYSQRWGSHRAMVRRRLPTVHCTL